MRKFSILQEFFHLLVFFYRSTNLQFITKYFWCASLIRFVDILIEVEILNPQNVFLLIRHKLHDIFFNPNNFSQ